MQRRNLIRGIAAAAFTSPALIPGLSFSATRTRIALALPITGTLADSSKDLLAGYEMAFARGRSAGIDVEAVIEDDKSLPANTASLAAAFAKDTSIVAMSGIVGTQNAKLAIKSASQGGLPVVGIRSGASELRSAGAGVYHLRASYEAEIAKMIAAIAGSGTKTVSVLYADDAFGKAGALLIQKLAPLSGVKLVGAVAADPTGTDAPTRALQAVTPSLGAQSLIILMDSGPMLAALTSARKDSSFVGPTFAMSFTATREVATSTAPYLGGLALVSAFPLPRTAITELGMQFSASATLAKKPELIQSLVAFEGFQYGSTLVAALKRARSNPTRVGLVQALASPLDIGGVEISFDAQNVGYKYLHILNKSGDGMLRA